MIGASRHAWETWSICVLTVGAVMLRPWRAGEALSAALGAAALLALGLITPADAADACRQGIDVYLFLAGMMLLAELARREGLFDWLAAYAVMHCRGSARRLFGLIYAVGILVTVFLSNDATAVVLTPAVYAAARRAGATPLPYLLVCAFIANAASFVLPISNPANLVVYGAHLPRLAAWLAEFTVPSALSIAVTFVLLRRSQRGALEAAIPATLAPPPLGVGGKLAAAGICATGGILIAASALDWPLGRATLIAGLSTALLVLTLGRERPGPLLAGISWSVLPLVAALFVLARAVENTGLLAPIAKIVSRGAANAPHAAALATGSAAALACNLVNNLPLGLIASAVARAAHLGAPMTGALLIGVDLGPNLSVTGSLATLLWLVALRREGEHISALAFLALGSLIMPPALLAALAGHSWLGAH